MAAPTVKPFKISVSEPSLLLLQQKLALASLSDALEDMGWEAGPPLSEMQSLLKHWQTSYDWRATEAKLNELPHFTTAIDVEGFGSIEMHFLHTKSKHPNAIPLCYVHGWPGSFFEGTKLIPELPNPPEGQPAFDVVVPSLVGFGFSEGVNKVSVINNGSKLSVCQRARKSSGQAIGSYGAKYHSTPLD